MPRKAKRKLKISKGPWRYTTKYLPGVKPDNYVYSNKDDVVVCKVGGSEDEVYAKASYERWEADKRLIALAPELLECLEELVKELDVVTHGCAVLFTGKAKKLVDKVYGEPVKDKGEELGHGRAR